MMGLNTFTGSMTDTQFSSYENILAFTASISGAYVAAEYRATLYTGDTSIWHGSIQCYASQSTDKTVYENQIPPVTSHASENRYIIMD